jgi:hypothetical protein
MPRFLTAAAKTLAAAGVTIAFAAVIPFANTGTGVAWAASRHMPTPAAGAASRLSGLPFGGASDYNGPPPAAQQTLIKPTANPDPTVLAAGTSRLSGLPFGGAGLCA